MRTTLSRSVTLILFSLVLLYFSFPISVTAQPAGSFLQVIPRPRTMTPSNTRFALTKEVRLVLAEPRSVDNKFSAEDFLSDARETANVTLRIGNARRHILVGELDRPRILAALKKAGANIPGGLDGEGYVLSVTEDQIVVGGQTEAGTFYGLQTLKQLVRGDGANAFVPGVQIVDWPSMRWRAVSDDISRGPVPTVEYIKRQLRTFAAYKLNMHSFYMEHTFQSRRSEERRVGK